MQQLWLNRRQCFTRSGYIKGNDTRLFAKWHQLQKQWSKNQRGHYEKKESISFTPDSSGPEEMRECYEEMKSLCQNYLNSIEEKYLLPFSSLSMKNQDKPFHVLRFLHYLPSATVIAHYDTSIMTCLYYRGEGLELKIDGQWIKAPNLKKDEMLVLYGIPGEILSGGNVKAIRHRVKCDERYVLAYFHNTPKQYTLSGENYDETTMAHVYQEAQLWYAGVNAREIRRICRSIKLPWYIVLYGWVFDKFTIRNEHHLAYQEESDCYNGRT